MEAVTETRALLLEQGREREGELIKQGKDKDEQIRRLQNLLSNKEPSWNIDEIMT